VPLHTYMSGLRLELNAHAHGPERLLFSGRSIFFGLFVIYIGTVSGTKIIRLLAGF